MALRFNKNIQGTRDSDNYRTPSDFYQKLNQEFNFTFDPCPFKHNLDLWDGLKTDWKGNVFVNPPYSNIEPWLKKGIKELKNGNANIIVYLIPLRTDSWYWHHTILAFAREVRLVRGRLNFGRKELAPFPVVLCVFDKNLNGEKILSSYEKNGVDNTQNSTSSGFPTENSFNMGLTATQQVATPKSSPTEMTSPSPNIKRNKISHL